MSKWISILRSYQVIRFIIFHLYSLESPIIIRTSLTSPLRPPIYRLHPIPSVHLRMQILRGRRNKHTRNVIPPCPHLIRCECIWPVIRKCVSLFSFKPHFLSLYLSFHLTSVHVKRKYSIIVLPSIFQSVRVCHSRLTAWVTHWLTIDEWNCNGNAIHVPDNDFQSQILCFDLRGGFPTSSFI